MSTWYANYGELVASLQGKLQASTVHAKLLLLQTGLTQHVID